MATNTISTDLWIETADPVTSVETDQWDFELTPHPEQELSTDLWLTETEQGSLPVYNPSLIIAVTRVQQNLAFPQFVIGGKGGANQDEYKLFKKSTSYDFYLWRTPVKLVGTDFDVKSISFYLLADIAAGMSIIPKLYFDDESVTSVGTTINLNNYSDRLIKLSSHSFNNKVHGRSNFFLELQIRSTILTPISLPIFIEIETDE